MSRIMFCASEEGMRRQVEALTGQNGAAPRLLTSDRDVRDALLALELGRDVVATVRSVATGWRLPVGVRIGFDAELDGDENAGIRDLCLARAAPVTPALDPLPVSLGRDDRDLFRVRVTSPFVPDEPALAAPEAA